MLLRNCLSGCTENVSKAFGPREIDPRKFVPKNICPRKFDPKENCPNGNLSQRKFVPKKRKLVPTEICPNGNLSQKIVVQQKFVPKNIRPRKFDPKEICPKGNLSIIGVVIYFVSIFLKLLSLWSVSIFDIPQCNAYNALA